MISAKGKSKQDNGHAFHEIEMEGQRNSKGEDDPFFGENDSQTSIETARPRAYSHSSSNSLSSKNAKNATANGYPPTYENSSARIPASQVEHFEGLQQDWNAALPPDEKIDKAELRRRRAKWFRESAVTGTWILSWYTFATLLSLYNKWMFSPEYYGFQYPLFVTQSHFLVQFCLAFGMRSIWPTLYKPKESPSRKDYIGKIVPTAIATGLDIGLSNLSLKTITLTLYTMCKSSTLIFVLIFAFTFKLEAFSIRLICVILAITCGVFLMVFNATTVSIPGIIMVFSASALSGLRWAFTQLLMHKQEMGMSNPFATIFWLAPVMAAMLAIVSMIIEGWITMFSSDFFEGIKWIQTTAVIIFPGTIAFLMVASEYFIIQRAGIVPLSIAGIFKEVTTISVSSWAFGDELTKLNELGVAITVGGIALYSYHKYEKQMQTGDDGHHSVPIATNGGPEYDPLEHHVLGDEEDEEAGRRRADGDHQPEEWRKLMDRQTSIETIRGRKKDSGEVLFDRDALR